MASTFWEGWSAISLLPWGRNWGEAVELVTTLMPSEQVRLDSQRLEILYNQLGEQGAEDVLCRAMEEMAIRIKQSERLYSAGAVKELRKTAHSLIAIADQVGLQTLASVASDVTVCIDRSDWIALGATFARLVRGSDQSITAIWDLQDITV